MPWVGEGDARHYEPAYRIEELFGGFEPQMELDTRPPGPRWYALTAKGYMADPDIYDAGSTGESFVRVILPTKEMAERAVLRAKMINQQTALKAVQ